MKVLFAVVALLALTYQVRGYRTDLVSDEILAEVQEEQGTDVLESLSGVQKSRRGSSRSKSNGGYNNQYDKPLRIECNTRKGEALYKVNSKFSGWKKDRQWKWGCRKTASSSLTNCKWTSEINGWRDTIRFMCPQNKIMAGLRSKHDNSKEDRRWKVKCCSAKGYHTEGCLMTRKLNQYKQAFSHQAAGATSCSGGASGVFVGMESDFKRQYNDRRWQLLECNFAKDDGNNDNDRDDDDNDRDNDDDDDDKDRSRGCDKDNDRSKDRDDDDCDKDRDDDRDKDDDDDDRKKGGCKGGCKRSRRRNRNNDWELN